MFFNNKFDWRGSLVVRTLALQRGGAGTKN